MVCVLLGRYGKHTNGVEDFPAHIWDKAQWDHTAQH